MITVPVEFEYSTNDGGSTAKAGALDRLALLLASGVCIPKSHTVSSVLAIVELVRDCRKSDKRVGV